MADNTDNNNKTKQQQKAQVFTKGWASLSVFNHCATPCDRPPPPLSLSLWRGDGNVTHSRAAYPWPWAQRMTSLLSINQIWRWADLPLLRWRGQRELPHHYTVTWPSFGEPQRAATSSPVVNHPPALTNVAHRNWPGDEHNFNSSWFEDWLSFFFFFFNVRIKVLAFGQNITENALYTTVF